MKIKVAIIDPIGSHGSSHHYYLFAQAKGLIENKVDVTIFSNKKTYLSSLGKIKVENTFGDIFKTKRKLEKRLIYLYFCHECDLSQLSIPKIQQEYLKVLSNNDFHELNYLDNSDVL